MSHGNNQMQIINLADNINAAVDKINENFELSGGVDSSSVINIIDGHLDSAYFTSTINEGYLNQFTISQGVDLTDVTNNINANATALSELTTRVNQDSNALSVLSSEVTSLETQIQGNINIDSATLASALASSQAFQGLVSQIDFDSEVGILSQGITDLQAHLTFTDADGQTVSNIAEVMQTLTAEIQTVEGQITTNATWNLQLVAGTEADPRFAGIQFSNDGQSADFTLSADKFKIVDPTSPTGSPIVPFSVDADGATLTNVKVTGDLQIGKDSDNAAAPRVVIRDDVTKIYDSAGGLRVQLGRLDV